MPLDFFSPVRESKKNDHLLTTSEIITSFFSFYIYFSALTTTFLVKGSLNTLSSYPLHSACYSKGLRQILNAHEAAFPSKDDFLWHLMKLFYPCSPGFSLVNEHIHLNVSSFCKELCSSFSSSFPSSSQKGVRRWGEKIHE